MHADTFATDSEETPDETPVLCAIAAAVLAAACRLHGEVVCPGKDRDGEMDGVVSFHCRTEPYFFMLDDADDPWRVEFADAWQHSRKNLKTNLYVTPISHPELHEALAQQALFLHNIRCA